MLSSQRAWVLDWGWGGWEAEIGLVPVCLLFFLPPKDCSSPEGHNLIRDLTQHRENVPEHKNWQTFSPGELEGKGLPCFVLGYRTMKGGQGHPQLQGEKHHSGRGTLFFFLFTFVRLHHEAEHELLQLKNNQFHPLTYSGFKKKIVAKCTQRNLPS